MNVLVLGASGMLGSAVVRQLSTLKEFNVTGTARGASGKYLELDALQPRLSSVIRDANPNWIINCIGVIKPYVTETDSSKVLNAIMVNSIFPFELDKVVSGTNCRVIQIGTDCVFSGKLGMYNEISPHDATDVYGKTKSLGEVPSQAFMHLRSSIIGPEQNRVSSLLEWFRSQPRQSNIMGFTDHVWNGVTTNAFANICAAVITKDLFVPGVQHLIPTDVVTKYELLEYFRTAYDRQDIKLQPVTSEGTVDRTLSTLNPDFNESLWQNSTFGKVPTIEEMVNSQALIAD